MKHLKHLLAALVLVSLVIFTNCGGGGGGKEPDPTDLQGEKLDATWTIVANGAKLGSQTVDGWTGFTLDITYDATDNSGTYSTTNSGSTDVWPVSGTWEFGTDIGTVVRNDDVDIDVEVTATTLKTTFSISGVGARTSSVNGDWVFDFISN